MNKLQEEDKKISEKFTNLYKICLDNTNCSIEFNSKRMNCWEKMKLNHLDNEPMKIFKNKHKQWELELIDINNRIELSSNELIEDYRDLEELLDFSN